jgi:Glycosyl transferase family 2
MDRVVARDKYLYLGERRFYACGVSYGPFAPNSRGERYPEPDRVAADFALMRELGANVVRTYVPPPSWMFEQAVRHELRLMVGMPWPFHMAFLDSREMTRDIRNTIRRAVSDMRRFAEALFAYTLGNEIRSDIVRWHGPRAVSRFLAELHDIGKQIDPDGLFTYANYPSTEYLDLSFLDLISFNVYLHRETDFRRYMTHLLALSGPRPLVLSETGMDTIREGEQHQGELLSWQSRAAFELGLAGFIVFAFTDEWHTGGSEITDWAFGLVTRERTPKSSFSSVAAVFKGELPPPLAATPRVSVVVAAYNAEATLDGCLKSLARLNYPDYETIVVDDGSLDATAKIAETAGVRTIRLEHRGLASARNAGVEAASGRIIAFIDADARADRDWLYHLVETIVRRGAAAAGGPNFAPTAQTTAAAALAAAPGVPREVRAGDDGLSQLCGCNMAIEKSALDGAGGFDPAFTAAGDDVDLSWRMLKGGATLALASGAVVTHQRRTALRAYLRQQAGYGAGEGLLFRKHPFRRDGGEGLYAASSWFTTLFGGVRVYYGAFGRGLFQTLYPSTGMPGLAELPLTIQWIVVAGVLLVAGAANSVLLGLGCIAIAISVATALAAAALARPEFGRLGANGRATLALACLLGPLIRSFARERIKWSTAPAAGEPQALVARGGLRLRGEILLSSGDGRAAKPAEIEEKLAAMRAALIRRGLAVSQSDGFEAYDLQIVIPLGFRVPINALEGEAGRITLRWRTAMASRPVITSGALFLMVLLAAGLSWPFAVSLLAFAAVGWAALAAWRLRRVPALLAAAGAEVCGTPRPEAASAGGSGR